MADLSIISITYNSEGFIKNYLLSLQRSFPKNSEIIIVDNGSTDKTLEKIKQYGEKLIKSDVLKIIPLNENFGFSRSNNMAVKKAAGEYLLFLNPDTEIIDGALNILLAFAEGRDFGIAAPKLIEPTGMPQPSVRQLPTLWGAVKEFILGMKNSFEPYVPGGEEEVGVECVLGAAFLMRRELFLDLRGFDERYFMYFEDLDLCRRVRGIGKEIFYLPQARIKHVVGGSKETKKAEWIRQAEKIYYGSAQAYLIGLVGRIGHKFLKHEV